MRYTPPPGSTDPNAPYVTGVPGVMRGSPVPAEAVENPQREIVEVIAAAGLDPSNEDLTQLLQAINKIIGEKAPLATLLQAGLMQPDGVTTTVDEEGLLSALGGNLLLNSKQWLTESGTFVAPVSGWYSGKMWAGGYSGELTQSESCGGASGRTKLFLVYLQAGQEVPFVVGAGGPSPTFGAKPNDGSPTSFGDITTHGDVESYTWIRGPMVTALSGHMRLVGGGPGGGYPGETGGNATQQERNAACTPDTHFGGGGAVSYISASVYGIGAGAPGSIMLFWHDPAKAAGPLPTPALFSARRLAPRAVAEPVVVNLYDPATGQGSVWREEDAEAKLAEGLITEAAWLEICAAKRAEEYAAWLVDPETEVERFEMLRQARDAKLSATDYLVAPDYPLTEEQRAAVTTYRQALRDLPAQEGAPWDGGGELTPWPPLPEFLQPHDA